MKGVIKWIFFVGIILVLAFYILSSVSTDVTKNLDGFIYDLPYKKGTHHKIVQGYGGLFSHMNVAALDFEMPEGTSVYAARSGTVYAFKDNSDEGGPFPAY